MKYVKKSSCFRNTLTQGKSTRFCLFWSSVSARLASVAFQKCRKGSQASVLSRRSPPKLLPQLLQFPLPLFRGEVLRLRRVGVEILLLPHQAVPPERLEPSFSPAVSTSLPRAGRNTTSRGAVPPREFPKRIKSGLAQLKRREKRDILRLPIAKASNKD